MHDWLKKNQKKLLAVIGAFLMVSFLVTTNPLGSASSGKQGRGAPIGKVGKTVLYQEDSRRAKVLWELLENSYLESYFKQFEQLISPIRLLGPTISIQMRDHPELLLLLVKEAEERGIAISNDKLQTEMTNEIRQSSTRGGTNDQELYAEAVRDYLMVQALCDQLLSSFKMTEPEYEHDFAEEFRAQRLDYVRYTANELKKTIAPATKPSGSTTQPTQPATQETFTPELKKLYNEFLDVDPNSPTKPATDPLGFGYKFPDRVKLQYFTIPRHDVLEYFTNAVAAGSSPSVQPSGTDLLSVFKKAIRERDLILTKKVWDEFFKNRSKYTTDFVTKETEEKDKAKADKEAADKLKAEKEKAKSTTKPFIGPLPATAPATNPSAVATTRPSTGPTTVATTSPATQPSTQPIVESLDKKITALTTAVKSIGEGLDDLDADDKVFAKLREELVTAGLKSEIDALQDQIAQAIRQKLTDDYNRLQPNTAATMPATASADLHYFQSDKYLDEVATSIQTRFQIRPEVRQEHRDWLSEPKLRDLDKIGGTSLATDAMKAAPFVKDASARKSALQLWQPGDVLKDKSDNVYVFRLTGASPEHPGQLNEIVDAETGKTIRAQVEDDWRTQLGYNDAMAKAEALMKRIAQTKSITLAAEPNKPPIATSAFNDMSARMGEFPEGQGTPELVTEGKKLAARATEADPNPYVMVPIPARRQVIVIQLKSVTIQVPPFLMSPGSRQPEMVPQTARTPEEFRAWYKPRWLGMQMQKAMQELEPYFTFDAVSKRMQFVAEQPSKSTS